MSGDCRILGYPCNRVFAHGGEPHHLSAQPVAMAKRPIPVDDRTQHDLSPLDLREFRVKAPPGATRMVVEEEKHTRAGKHHLRLIYTTSRGRFLYCKAAGGSFSDVLEQLKSCTNQAAKIDPRAKANVEDPLKGQF